MKPPWKDPERLEEVVSYLIRPRHMLLGAFLTVVVFVVFALAVAHVIHARHARALAVIECTTQMRTAQTIPEVLWDADDFHAAALVWCDDFVERSGRTDTYDTGSPF